MPIYAYRPYRPYGLWSLKFYPSFDQNWDIKVFETIHFLNLQDDPINLSPFSLKLDQLENLTLYKRSMTFCYFDRYLENET